MKTGRPCKLTAALQAKICKAIADGNYREVAAGWAGVPLSTFKSWITKGRKQVSGQFRDFLDSIQRAEAAAESSMVKAITLAAKDDPRHAEWWLARKFPERWSQHTDLIKQLMRDMAELEKDVARLGHAH